MSPHRTMSAFGTKRTWSARTTMSAFGSKADMRRTLLNVCFRPKADIGQRWVNVPRLTQSRSLCRSYTAELLPLSNLYAATPISPMRSKNRDLEKMETGHAFHCTKATDWFLQVAVEKSGVPCCAALQPRARKHRD